MRYFTRIRSAAASTACRLARSQAIAAHASKGSRTLQLSTWSHPTAADALKNDPDEVFQSGVRLHHTANTAYPIDHGTTTRPYRMKRTRDQHDIRRTLEHAYGGLGEMMLYVHIPFCASRCQFCEYTVVDPKQGRRDTVQDRYFEALGREFDLYSQLLGTKEKALVGFDIGGGTPSMASIDNVAMVMDKARDSFQFDPSEVEVSIETTPKIAAAEPEKIQAYYDMGIRRISMGVQTTDFALASRLGRHDGDYLAAARDNIRRAGFESFNIDLMYGFPLRAKSEDKWEKTVQQTVEQLAPDHVTLYRMRYKGTKMAHLQERVGLQQVNEQADLAGDVLRAEGYTGWVGKNTFSRLPGNSGCSDYLAKRVVEGVPYIGMGLGAQSFSHSTLQYNLGGVTKRLEQYLRSVELGRLPIQDLYHLSKAAAQGKFCSVSFYFGGINLAAFERNFGGEPLEAAFSKEVAFVLTEGLMEYAGKGTADHRLAMTAKGKAHYGGVLALFYSPSVQRALMEMPGGELGAARYLEAGSVSGGGSLVYQGSPAPRYEPRRQKKKKKKKTIVDPREPLHSDWENHSWIG